MYITLILIGLGLAMDAFSVSISNGLCMKKVGFKEASKVGLFFGVAQGVMPVIGYFGGLLFSAFIESVDHWIAFVILSFIGIKMISEAVEKMKKNDSCCTDTLTLKELFFQAIATSIDALAVGVSFAALNINIFFAASVIMIITFIISTIGVFIGKSVGKVFKEKAEIFGGIILIGIGIKILIEHLFF